MTFNEHIFNFDLIFNSLIIYIIYVYPNKKNGRFKLKVDNLFKIRALNFLISVSEFVQDLSILHKK